MADEGRGVIPKVAREDDGSPEIVVLRSRRDARTQPLRSDAPPSMLSPEVRREIFEKLGNVDMRKLPDVSLGPRTPWVADVGFLDVLGALEWAAQARYVLLAGEEPTPGRVEIWLQGLEANTGYLLLVSVGCEELASGEQSAFAVGSSEFTYTPVAALGGDQVIPAYLPNVDPDPAVLVSVRKPGPARWTFYEAALWRVTS